MKMKKMLAAGSAVALATTFAAATAPANAAKGEVPLSQVVIDENKFDRNNADFDILSEAVLAVLADNPESPVSALTDGSVKLTAFAPTDKAFKKLARAVTGEKMNEKKAFATVASLGLETVEQVLLYHVVPGKPIPAKKAVKANNVKLETAQGKSIKVKVKQKHDGTTIIRLKDKDPDLKNPKVIVTDVNKGNKQIAHGINNVLLPVNL